MNSFTQYATERKNLIQSRIDTLERNIQYRKLNGASDEQVKYLKEQVKYYSNVINQEREN